MKVIRFPGAESALGEEIDAMLNGELAGPQALSLRELREDVRALALPLDPEFERELQMRVGEWAREQREPRPPLRERVSRRLTASPGRSLALGGVVAALAALLVVFVLVGGSSNQYAERSFPKNGPIAVPHAAKAQSAAGSAAEQLGTSAPAASAPARLQQQGGSVTLAPSGEGVQEAADSVTSLAASDGGYISSSHVQIRHGGTSEAQIVLNVPSKKLNEAIAALGRIAPERAVSQESQDITGTYEAAQRQLHDDEAVRRALLRALSNASTQGEIESLRDRLASNREALAHDRAAVKSVSTRASTSQLEVTITGGAAKEGLTLSRGLDDAGDVLAAVGAVLLIALAVLVPLGLVLVALAWVRRTWLRRRREAALEL
ncbi:MAG TPA: DUF4349 domain-containing protein [Solirubrobacteraceae bacterium]|jgi:hypothetical protein|nr:DUF4349 domain-containing protein [Solirubrobacteraceae bacterium]